MCRLLHGLQVYLYNHINLFTLLEKDGS